MELEDMRRTISELTYKQHGGSGYNWRPADVWEMELGEIQWYLDNLAERRRKESEAIKRASRKK